MKTVNLPEGGCSYPELDHSGVCLQTLEVEVGGRTETTATLNVRGTVRLAAGTTTFIGTTIVCEGRSVPEHNITFIDGGLAEPGDSDDLASVIHLALDEFTDITAIEMARICGD
jgi:hypothetical protein